jgi:NADH-quinone oxidoreductase subunit G
MARAWGVASLPPLPGRDTTQILAAAAGGDIDALVIAGVDLDDLPDPEAARAALEATPFVVSLELRPSAVTDRADVVLPVAAVAEKPGTFVNWEGRPGTFKAVLDVPGVESDLHVLRRIADEMDVHLGLPDAAAARRELAALGVVGGSAVAEAAETAHGAPLASAPDTGPPEPGPGEALLVTWHQLLDAGRMQDGEPFLAGTARPVVARMSAATAAQAGTSDGGKVAVATARGSLTLPVEVAVMPDRVVWLPTRSAGSEVRRELAAGHGSLVTLRSAE